MGITNGTTNKPWKRRSHSFSSTKNQMHHGCSEAFVTRSRQTLNDSLFDKRLDFVDAGKEVCTFCIR